MNWYEAAIKLNPYDPYNYLRYGMCLDWLGKTQEAKSYYQQAKYRDPNGYFTDAILGWHCYQTEQYQLAKYWLNRSLKLRYISNTIAEAYLPLVEKKLTESP